MSPHLGPGEPSTASEAERAGRAGVVPSGAGAERAAAPEERAGGLAALAAAWLRGLLLSVAAAYALAFVVVACLRLGYPFELEWMEGGTLSHLRRVLRGDSLYVPPTLAFVPYIYAPLYYYVAAPLAWIFGVGFLPLRLLSLLSALGASALIYAILRRETGRAEPAFLGASLFLACFDMLGGWFDLARVDSLALVLLLGAFYLLRFVRSPSGHVLAGLCGVLSILAKQTGLMILLPLAAYEVITRRRRSLPFVLSFGGLLAASHLGFEIVTGGWFRYYAFHIAGSHPIVGYNLYYYWSRDLLGPLGIACALALASFVPLPSRSPDGASCATRTTANRPAGRGLYAVFTAAALITSWVGRVHAGGAINVLFPAGAALGVAFGLGLDRLARLRERAPAGRHAARIVVYGACLLQFIVLAYDPRGHLPSAADRRAGEDLVRMLREIPGDVFVLSHGYLAELAGKPEHAHYMAMEDVLRSRREKPVLDLENEFRAAVRARRFAAIVVDHPSPLLTELGGIDLDSTYVEQRRLFERPDGGGTIPLLFHPVNGFKTRPRVVFVPR